MFTLLALAAYAQQLPTVVDAVPPVYPPEALDRAEPAEVLLRVTIDDTGAVQGAIVDQSVDPVFDAAALDAIRATRFTPALDASGAPAWSEILYAVRFDRGAALPLSIEGQLRIAGTNEPAVGRRLVARRGEQLRYATVGDDGGFRFEGLEPGPWALEVDASGFAPLEQTVEVREGKVVTARLFARLDRPWEDDEDFDTVIEVKARPPAAEIAERVLTTDDIRYLPGTGGDLIRAVQNLPGVGRPAFNIGQLLIRGTAPEDSAYYLDGARLPAVFHFAGLSTVINGDALEDVALLAGNYSTRYGRTLGGLVDLRVDSSLPERSRGYVSVDLLQATAFVEQKVGDRTSVTLSGRRSYIDAVLTPVLSATGSSTVRAPRYYDMQARVLHHTDQGVIDAMFLLSDDSFRVLGDAEDPDEVQIGLTDRFQKFRLRWTHQLGDGWSGEVSFLIGPESRSFDIAPNGNATETRFALNQRMELRRAYKGGWHAWRMGLDLFTGAESFRYDVPDFGVLERGSVWFTSPSPYVEPSVRFGPVELTGGLRVDPWLLDAGYRTVAVDPRFVARVEASDRTRFKAAVGQFSQLPGVRQVLERQAGNPDLGPQRSIQTSVGVEQQLGPLDLEVTAFGNLLRDLVVGREDAFRFFTGPPPAGPLDTGPYANEGVGRIGGVEVLAKLQRERLLAWVSATYSRSLRTKREGQDEKLFEFDQPLLVNALASYELPKGWRLGGRVRLGSGNPYNQVVNRVWDADARSFRPVYDPKASRLPTFFMLDVRVDKEFVFNRWKLTTYLDIQNATNRANVDLMGWTDDFEQETPVAGLPIVPAFGFRGEW